MDHRFWHTSLDIDDMHFIPAEAVEVIEILEDTPPVGPASLTRSRAPRRRRSTWPYAEADETS